MLATDVAPKLPDCPAPFTRADLTDHGQTLDITGRHRRCRAPGQHPGAGAVHRRPHDQHQQRDEHQRLPRRRRPQGRPGGVGLERDDARADFDVPPSTRRSTRATTRSRPRRTPCRRSSPRRWPSRCRRGRASRSSRCGCPTCWTPTTTRRSRATGATRWRASGTCGVTSTPATPRRRSGSRSRRRPTGARSRSSRTTTPSWTGPRSTCCRGVPGRRGARRTRRPPDAAGQRPGQGAVRLGPDPLVAAGARPLSRVLVVGATGHVGGWLVPDLVRAGHEVVAFSRGTSSPTATDAAWDSVERWSTATPSTPTARSPTRCCRPPRRRGRHGLLRAGVGAGAGRRPGRPGRRLVMCGTIWVHGATVVAPIRESDPRRPYGEYGVQKAAIERIVLASRRAGGRAAPGPHQRARGGTSSTRSATSTRRCGRRSPRGEQLAVPIDGVATMDHVHAADVAAAFEPR